LNAFPGADFLFIKKLTAEVAEAAEIFNKNTSLHLLLKLNLKK
jgi:hypothetical protein